jgi:hypothetical protein
MYALPAGVWRPIHSLPTLNMTADRSGATEDTRLEQLRRQYSRWSMWRGSFTGDYWAMPPRGHPTLRDLICAHDLDELALSLAQAERQHDL